MKNHPVFIGIEGGATRTVAILVDQHAKVLRRTVGGGSNLRLSNDQGLLHLLRLFRKDLTGPWNPPVAVGIFVAGCLTFSDKSRLKRLAQNVWPESTCVAGNDTVSGMEAALGHHDGILVICGTGSIVRARKGSKSVKAGGWGHVGGDRGSGYWMGRKFLRRIFQQFDETGKIDPIMRSVLSFIHLNKIEELVQWSLENTKEEVASLTKVLFQYRTHQMAREIIEDAIAVLTEDILLAAKKSGLTQSRKRFPVALNPGLASYQPLFKKLLTERIQRKIPQANIFVSTNEGALGSALIALRSAGMSGPKDWMASLGGSLKSEPLRSSKNGLTPTLEKRGLAVAMTEQRNPRTTHLDKLSIPKLIRVILKEERQTVPAILKQEKKLSNVIDWIVSDFKKKGRLFYIGAGTSGRLGVLDAAECPPTFSTDPEMIQGIMAGGRRALYQAVESAEDNTNDGRQAVWDRDIGKNDVVIGITASGSTPFVLGALEAAHSAGASTVLLTFNPRTAFTLSGKRFLKVAIATGPEVIAGSTRMKAGTATKLVLNLLSTASMVRLGKVRSNLMVDLDPTCEKLHSRAARIYSILKKVPYEKAWEILEKRGWDLKGMM